MKEAARDRFFGAASTLMMLGSPGTGTPQPGGLSWYQAVAVVRALARESEAELFGADIVEVAPMDQSRVNEIVAAKLGFKLLSYLFAPRS